jgi:ketol-acid reductoisomerase
MNRYLPSKSVSITNSFEGIEEKLDDASTNVRMGKIAKYFFIARDDNFLLLSQLLKEIAAGEYEIKITNEQIKVQLETLSHI